MKSHKSPFPSGSSGRERAFIVPHIFLIVCISFVEADIKIYILSVDITFYQAVLNKVNDEFDSKIYIPAKNKNAVYNNSTSSSAKDLPKSIWTPLPNATGKITVTPLH